MRGGHRPAVRTRDHEPRRGSRRRSRRRGGRPQQHRAPPARRSDQDDDRCAAEPVRLARNDEAVPRLHVLLQERQSWPLARARVPVRSGTLDVHRRVRRGDVEGRGHGPRVGAADGRLSRRTVRRGARRPSADDEPQHLAAVPDGARRTVVERPGRPARRRGAHGALLRRVRDADGDGRCRRLARLPRARHGCAFCPACVRGAAPAAGRKPAARRTGVAAVVRRHRAVHVAGPGAVHLLAADAIAQDHARGSARPRPGIPRARRRIGGS